MKKQLDRITGLAPMYKMILIFLLAISVLAFVLAAVGQLAYDPLAMLASFAIATAVSFASGWAAARIARTRFHFESSVITGFLIFLIVNPSLEPLSLVGTALAAVLATASKYVLAVRGRHLFNPAAVGLFVVGITGLAYPGWWVGTPALQPLIILGALAILYRTQHLAMGVVFVVVAGAINVGATVLGGGDVALGLSFTFLSSPLVFFAGFMLSEPLTLPPRRWQQLALAVVVALPFAIPFNSGVANKYLLALLIGNLIAFFFGQRRGIGLRYLGKTQIGAGTWELAFQPARPVRFAAGQYMELTIPHRRADFRGTRRYFSVSSAPSASGPITFAITVPAKSSSFKRALLDLEPGAVVHGTGVGGDFVLPKDAAQPLLLVAGGIGITPFASQLAHATERGDRRDVVVVYATSTAGDLPYRELLERSGARVVLFGPDAPATLPATWQYGGAGRVTGERLAQAVPDASRRRAYVSGPPALVADLRRALRAGGTRRVHADYFSGY